MKKYDKVLFVSHSDTCRGPMAEAILQHKLLLEDILVDSKGMIVLFPEPVNPKARDVLVQHNLELEEHEAVQFSADDFDERTLILTMEKTQKRYRKNMENRCVTCIPYQNTARWRMRKTSMILMEKHWKNMGIALMYWKL